MIKGNLLNSLLGIVISALIAPQAMASVCLAYSSSGSCLFYSGSVSCEDINVAEKGTILSVPSYITCTIAASDKINGIVFCATKDGKVSAGVSGSLAAKGFTSAHAKFTLDKKGNASGIKTHASASQAQLAKLNHFCPKKQTAVDFVPAAMNAKIQIVDAKGKVIPNNTSSFNCTLPKPKTLGWNTKTKSPERRKYNCTKQ